jgi:Flp pilus assembly protein TadG
MRDVMRAVPEINVVRDLRSRDGSRGQAMTEFALIAPLFFLLLFAIIQLGFLLGGQVGFTNGVRETARYASTLPNATAAQVQTELLTRQLPKAIPGFRSANIVAASTTVSYCYYPNPNNTVSYPSYSLRVIVNAVYRHPLFVPLVSNILDGMDGTPDSALTATVHEEMRVENPRITSIPTGGIACP